MGLPGDRAIALVLKKYSNRTEEQRFLNSMQESSFLDNKYIVLFRIMNMKMFTAATLKRCLIHETLFCCASKLSSTRAVHKILCIRIN